DSGFYAGTKCALCIHVHEVWVMTVVYVVYRKRPATLELTWFSMLRSIGNRQVEAVVRWQAVCIDLAIEFYRLRVNEIISREFIVINCFRLITSLILYLVFHFFIVHFNRSFYFIVQEVSEVACRVLPGDLRFYGIGAGHPYISRQRGAVIRYKVQILVRTGNA